MKIRQQQNLESNAKAWQSSLEFFRQENALLKYRLSEMVDNNEGSHFLQMAEHFQNELLISDENLKNLFSRLDGFLKDSRHSDNDGYLTAATDRKYIELKQDISNFEKKFLNLTQEFNSKMMESSQH